jgi:transposase
MITMGRSKDLAEQEKKFIIKEIAKGKTPKAIAEKIGRHVITVERFLKNPCKRKPRRDRGVVKSVSKRDMNRLRRTLRKMPGATSARIFEDAGLPDFAKTTRNRLLRKVASVKSPAKRPPLTSRHKRLRMDWSKKYMKTDMKHVLFTDESRATLDGPDGWAKGWVFHGDDCPTRMRRQQGGGGVMFWAGIIGDDVIGPFRVPEGVKLTSTTYCQFLKDALDPWLDDLPLSVLKKIIFMHDNAPSHAAKATTAFLQSLGFVNDTLMVWPPNSPDLNPIENMWSIVKRIVYADGRQYSSKDDLWKAIKRSTASIPKSTIKNLTDSVNDRLFEVIKRHGAHVNK